MLCDKIEGGALGSKVESGMLRGSHGRPGFANKYDGSDEPLGEVQLFGLGSITKQNTPIGRGLTESQAQTIG